MHIELTWGGILAIAFVNALLAVLLNSVHPGRSLWLVTAAMSLAMTACLLVMRNQFRYPEEPFMLDVLVGVIPPWAVGGFVFWLEKAQYSRVLQVLGGICCFFLGLALAVILGLVIFG
jgi:hypothetical protein